MSFKAIIVFFMLISGHAFAEDASSASYQQEFIFLKTQFSALKSRRAKTIKQLKRIESDLSKEVFSLGSAVSRLNSSNESLKSQLVKFDEYRSDKEMSSNKIEVVSSQMKKFVEKYKKNTSALNPKKTHSFIMEFLDQGSTVFESKGFVYNKKGVKTEADLLNLGHVASYVKSSKGFTPLSAGKVKTDLFLTDEKPLVFSNENKALNLVVLKEGGVKAKPLTLGAILRGKLKAGGAVGYIIIILGLIGVGIAFLRFTFISPYNKFDEVEVRNVIKKIQMGDVKEAKDLLEKQKITPLTYFIEKLISYRHKSDEVYEAIVLDEISNIQSKVSKYGPYLIVLAAVAPLLGLLGTVTGMIGTFDMITLHGTGNPKLLSGGIKEALVTTQMGLIVAIPCILAGNYLSSKALKVISKFEEVASTLPRV